MVFTETFQPGPNPPAVLTGSIVINFQGTLSDFRVAYVIQTTGNAIPLTDGGTLLFPSTPANTTVVATVALYNRGSAGVNVNSVALTNAGTEFQLLGLPLLPGTLAANSQVQFILQFSPKQSGTYSATLKIEAAGKTFTVLVQAASTGPAFKYELIDGENAAPLDPNVPFALPDTPLGDTRSFVVRVRNTGDGDGQITAINILGQGFQLADLPFLPVKLAPGSSLFFTVSFVPVVPGRVIGRLRIGDDTFELSASGIGPKLVFSYSIGSASVTVVPGGTVNFPPSAVGQKQLLDFTIGNTGSTDAVIISIATTSSGEFSVSNRPPLPLSLAPNSQASFRISFGPYNPGLIASTLRIDSYVFNLSGFASAPPSLPGYRFDGASGVQEPSQQVSAGLTLNAPYPSAISGALTLSFNAQQYATDPAVQFANGGRTVSFTIPANTTRALFPNNATGIRLQTGTVAGDIVLTPSFTTGNGYNLTPDNPPCDTITIPSRPPVLLSLDLTAQSAAGLTLVANGYATTRNLARVDIEFQPRPGVTLANAKLSVDVSAQSTLWYRSSTSQGYGGLFTITLPISAQGVPSLSSLLNSIQSVSMTASNELGTSSPVRVTLP